VVWTNLGLLAPLGIHVAAPEFPIDRVESAAAREVAERAGGRYAVINPGAAWPTKRWEPSRLAAVAAALRDEHSLPSVVTWGPGEESLAREVVAASAGAAILAPPTSVADLVAISRGAALFVSGDTGPAHIAAAVGTPIVGIYGPTRPARNGPWSPDDVTVSRDEVCQCHHLRRCRLKTMCLDDIKVDEVHAAIERRLAGAPRA
jgi:ADP-heptose:LPS heptosyltransferase